MKKIVIFGSSGMAGHMVYRYFQSLNKYELLGISKTEVPGIESRVFDIEDNMPECLDFLLEYKPDVIINCIGILIQASQENPVRSIFVNSCFPHILEDLGKLINSRIIHISTDCVFNGEAGPYIETDWPTERNWYGRSKALGEIVNDKDLTIRTSIIGPELKANGTGLFSWFMSQTGQVNGYTNVFWNGITTLEFAKQIDQILETNLSGLYHLTTTTPIAKGELLLQIRDVWQRTDIEILLTAVSKPQNKVLYNNRLTEYNPNIPSYRDQLQTLKDFYNKIE